MAYTIAKLANYEPETLDVEFRALFGLLDSDSQRAQTDSEVLQSIREAWLGRKSGVITQVGDLWLKPAPKDQKKDVGRRLNELKSQVEQIIDSASKSHSSGIAESRLRAESLDVTLPGTR